MKTCSLNNPAAGTADTTTNWPSDAMMRIGFYLILVAFGLARPALCQDLQWQRGPSRSVYVCPGLNATAAVGNPERVFPELSQEGSPCPCYPEGAEDVKVALGDPFLLLSLPRVHIDYPKFQCRWYREYEKTWKRWDVTYDGSASWLKTLCGIQQALPGQICFREVEKAGKQQVEHWTAAFTPNPLSKNPAEWTNLGTVSVDVVARCTANADCHSADVCDDGLHYCRHVCDGPKGGTRHCTSAIGERATCHPDRTVPLRFRCVCNAFYVEEFATNGSLVNCKDACLDNYQCNNLDEVCLVPLKPNDVRIRNNSSGAYYTSKGGPNAKKTCVKVCSAADSSAPLCGRNQRCQPVKSSDPAKSVRRGECVCISSAAANRYYPLPDNSGCEEAHVGSEIPEVQVLILDNTQPPGYRLLDSGIDSPRGLKGLGNGVSTLLTVVRGDNIKLRCLVRKAFPRPNITWDGDDAAKPLIKGVSGPHDAISGETMTHWQNYWTTATLGVSSSSAARPQADVRNEKPRLTCKASHEMLGTQGSATIHVDLNILDCAQDSNCAHHEVCRDYKCVNVCDIHWSRCKSDWNEECTHDNTHAHQAVCVCKNGFRRDDDAGTQSISRCFKKCDNNNFQMCPNPQQDTCHKGLCKKACDVYPACDTKTTECKPNGNGTRACKCLQKRYLMMYTLNDTACQAPVLPSPWYPDVNVGDARILCDGFSGRQRKPLAQVQCEMPKAVRGDTDMELRVVLKNAFPNPELRLLPSAGHAADVQYQSQQPSVLLHDGIGSILMEKQPADTTGSGTATYTYTLLSKVRIAHQSHTKTLTLALKHASFTDITQQELMIDINLNITGCTSNGQCNADQVCGTSKADGQPKCLGVCSKDLVPRASWQNCPENSICEADKTKDHTKMCTCNSNRLPHFSRMQDGQMQCPKKCWQDNQCGASERCWLPTIPPEKKSRNPDYINQKACLPTCETISCGSNATCKSVEDHKFQCVCKIGSFTENGETKGDINRSDVSCHGPILPTPPHPTISMKTGLLPEKTLCLEGKGTEGCSVEFFGAEGREMELWCHLSGVFPKPQKVILESMEPDGKVTELWSGELQPSSDHAKNLQEKNPLAKNYKANISILAEKILNGQKIRCKVERPAIPADAGSTQQFWSATTSTKLQVYECSAPGSCGSIVTHNATPSKKVVAGNQLELKCQTDFPLLQDGDKTDCSWTLTRRSIRSLSTITVDFASWKTESFLSEGIGSSTIMLARTADKAHDTRRDCSIFIKEATLAVEGNWTCSALLFDGSKATVKGDSSGLEEKVPVVVVVQPSSIYVTLTPNSDHIDQAASFNITSEENQQLSSGHRGFINRKRVRLEVAEPVVTFTFKCIANHTRPAPTKFIWMIPNRRAVAGFNHTGIKEELPVAEIRPIMEEQTIGSSRSGSVTDFPSRLLKTYSSTYNKTFVVRDDNGDWLLDQAEVTCAVSYADEDRNGQDVALTNNASQSIYRGQTASLMLVFQEGCTEDSSSCFDHERCQQREDQPNTCVHVCQNHTGCDAAKHEVCTHIVGQSTAHQATCVCKDGFSRDDIDASNATGMCFKQCDKENFQNCSDPGTETCYEGLCKAVCDAPPSCDVSTTRCKPDGNGSRTCQCLDDSQYPLEDTHCQAPVKTSDLPDVYIGDKKLDCAYSYSLLVLSLTAPIPCEMPEAVLERGSETVVEIVLKRAFPEPKLRLLPASGGNSSFDHPAWNISTRKDHKSRTIEGNVAFTYTLQLKVKLSGSLGDNNETLLLALEHPSFHSRQEQPLKFAVRLKFSDSMTDVQGLTMHGSIFGSLLLLFGILVTGSVYLYVLVLKRTRENGAAKQSCEIEMRPLPPAPPGTRSIQRQQMKKPDGQLPPPPPQSPPPTTVPIQHIQAETSGRQLPPPPTTVPIQHRQPELPPSPPVMGSNDQEVEDSYM